MCKRILSTVLLLIVGLSGIGLSGCERTKAVYDFNKVRWGMPKATVKQAEGTLAPQAGAAAHTWSSEDTWSFNATLLGQACTGVYTFEHDRLARIELSYRVARALDEEAVAFFNSVAQSLTAQYGEPLLAEQKWTQPETERAPDGVLSYPGLNAQAYCYWLTRRTRVDLVLFSVTTDDGWPLNPLSQTSEIRIIYQPTPKELWQTHQKSRSRR